MPKKGKTAKHNEKQLPPKKRKSSSRNRSKQRWGVSLEKLSIQGKRNLNLNENNNYQSLNNPQVNFTNPNRFWTMCKATTPGGMCVKGREPIGNLLLNSAATGQFAQLLVEGHTEQEFEITPNNASFPRLASLAKIYEFYAFRKFRFEFISTQPTTAPGQILMMADYTASGSAPMNTQEVLANITSVISSVYANTAMVGTLNLSRMNRFCCRLNETVDDSGQTNSNQAVQANAYFFSQGFTGAIAAVVGLLMVDYEIEFFSPDIPKGLELEKKIYSAQAGELKKLINAGMWTVEQKDVLVNSLALILLAHPATSGKDRDRAIKVLHQKLNSQSFKDSPVVWTRTEPVKGDGPMQMYAAIDPGSSSTSSQINHPVRLDTPEGKRLSQEFKIGDYK